MMAAAAVFASNPAIQRRRPFGVSIAGRRAAIASRAFRPAFGAGSGQRGKADEIAVPTRSFVDSAFQPRGRRARPSPAATTHPSRSRTTGGCAARCSDAKLDEVLALAASSLASWNHVTLAAAFVALASNARTKSSLGTCSQPNVRADGRKRRTRPSRRWRARRRQHPALRRHPPPRQRRFFDRKSSPAPRLQSGPDLALALDAAVERTAGHMRPREVAAALWSYAALDARPSRRRSRRRHPRRRECSNGPSKVDHRVRWARALARWPASRPRSRSWA